MSEKRTLQETASLHEKAVQAIARGDVPLLPRKARKSAQRTHPVYTGVVNPEVIRKARQIIYRRGSTYTRWEALGPNEVLVR